MGLFDFGKKKEEKKGCCCGADTKNEINTDCCCSKETGSLNSVKVLGAGCKSCHEQLENAKGQWNPWDFPLRWNISRIWKKLWVTV